MKLAGGCRLDKPDSEAFLAGPGIRGIRRYARHGIAQAARLEPQTYSVLRAAALTHWVDWQLCQGDSRQYPAATPNCERRGAAARYYRDGFDQSNDR